MTLAMVQPIRKASREMVRALGLLQMQSLEHSMTRCHIMVELNDHGKLTAAELADTLRLDRSTMSRTVSKMEREGLVTSVPDEADRRRKPLTLTDQGREVLKGLNLQADSQVSAALNVLTEDQRATVLQGLSLYGKALKRAEERAAFTIRPVEKRDNAQLARVIRQVLEEYGANGPGFAYVDPELDYMYDAFNTPKHFYLVIERDGKILGGGGVAPLSGSTDNVCELQKMYLLPELRGFGMGAEILKRCLEAARQIGYAGCYLETLATMDRAQRLYQSFGFEKRSCTMGDTGHSGCDRMYYQDL